MTALSLSGSRRMNDDWTGRLALGVVLDGKLTAGPGRVHDFRPGGLVGVGLDKNGNEGRGWKPSLDYSLSLGATWARTTLAGSHARTGYFAGDLRLGVRTSWLLAGRTLGYTGTRVFGGPVSWKIDGEDVMGTDVHHYQLAVGVAGQAGPVGYFAEWAALGEQGFSVGLSTLRR